MSELTYKSVRLEKHPQSINVATGRWYNDEKALCAVKKIQEKE